MDVPLLAAFVQETPQNPAPAGDAPPASNPGTASPGTAGQGTSGQGTSGQGTSGQGTTGTDQPAGQAAPGGFMGAFGSFVPFILIIVIFYFLMIAPERKQRKKREAMLAAVKKGDKVITTGGMFASVAAVNEDSITLQATDDVRLRFSRQSIAQVIEVDGADSSAKG